MTVIFRADADTEIGAGHVVRSARLAQMVKSLGHDVKLVSASITQELCEWLEDQAVDFELICAVDKDSDIARTSAITRQLGPNDWLVVDHYGIDAMWESLVDRGLGRLMVIDDLANRHHACDALLDVGMHAFDRNPYEHLVPPDAQLFLGPRYALIPDEVIGRMPRKRTGIIAHVLVFLGGGNNSAASLHKIASALEQWGHEELAVSFLAHRRDLEEIHPILDRNESFRALSPMVAMADLLDWADLAIGTCGNASWERFVLGVPSVCVVTAPNQQSDAELLAQEGAIISLGKAEDLKVSYVHEVLSTLGKDPHSVLTLSQTGFRIMEGRLNATDHLLRLFAIQA